jgi:dihydrofolate reductase
MACVPKNEDVYIIGGAEIYKQALQISTKIELTRVHQEFEADAFYPVIDANEWQLIASEYHPKDEKHLIDFTFQTFVKK